MELVYFLFLLGLICAGIKIATEEFGGIILLFVGIGLFFLHYSEHNSDITLIKNQEAYVQVQQDYINSLKVSLEAIQDKTNTLANQDSPVATLALKISDAEKDIRDAKKQVLEAQMSIDKRQNGITAWVLWFY
jgi:septal ring factor EnvC (AmiA/AmiB activator)